MRQAEIWQVTAKREGKWENMQVEATNAKVAKLRAQELLYEKYGTEWTIARLKRADDLYL